MESSLAVRLFVNAGWSSSVARRAHNPEVRGSNPLPATKKNTHRSMSVFLERLRHWGFFGWGANSKRPTQGVSRGRGGRPRRSRASLPAGCRGLLRMPVGHPGCGGPPHPSSWWVGR